MRAVAGCVLAATVVGGGALPGQVTAPPPQGRSAVAPAGGTSAGSTPAWAYQPPVRGPLIVVRAFVALAGPYGPGHLGVDLALGQGAVVWSAAPGLVTFAGQVAGRGVLVVRHPDGVSTEYEPVRPLVHSGQSVAGGQRVAVLVGHHRGCRRSCLHWGARRAGRYLDPLSLLRQLGVLRLEPW